MIHLPGGNKELYFSCADKNINGGGSWNVTPCQIRTCVRILRTTRRSTRRQGFEIQGNALVKTMNLFEQRVETLNGGGQ